MISSKIYTLSGGGSCCVALKTKLLSQPAPEVHYYYWCCALVMQDLIKWMIFLVFLSFCHLFFTHVPVNYFQQAVWWWLCLTIGYRCWPTEDSKMETWFLQCGLNMCTQLSIHWHRMDGDFRSDAHCTAHCIPVSLQCDQQPVVALGYPQAVCIYFDSLASPVFLTTPPTIQWVKQKIDCNVCFPSFS